MTSLRERWVLGGPRSQLEGPAGRASKPAGRVYSIVLVYINAEVGSQIVPHFLMRPNRYNRFCPSVCVSVRHAGREINIFKYSIVRGGILGSLDVSLNLQKTVE